MALLALAILAFAAAGGFWAIGTTARRHRTPPELRGDWWTGFEREFWTYAEQLARRDGERRRHHGERA